MYLSIQLSGQGLHPEELKLSILFGSTVQMAFDGADRKARSMISEDGQFLETGDVQFYRSKYRKAVNSYYWEFERLITEEKREGPIDVFSFSKNLDKRYSKPERLLRSVGSKNLNQNQWLILASVINNLGIYNQQIGNLNVAEQLLVKSLQIRAEHTGKTSEYYVASLHNLAILRIDQGRYNAAEDMLKYAVRYYKKIKSENSYQYAVVVNNQAMLYLQLGRTAEAEELLNQLLDNASIEFPDNSLDPARIITNKALITIEKQDYDQASLLLNQSLKVYQEKEQMEHSDYQQIRLQLAQVYRMQGNLSSLNSFIDETLVEIEKHTEKNSLSYSNALEVKADYLLDEKNYTESLLLFKKIAAIRASTQGVLHKDFLRVKSRQAICEWKLGLINEALNNFKTTTQAYLEVVDKFFYNMSENEKARFWQTLKPELHIFYSFMLDQYTQNPELLILAYNLRLKTKGLLLSNSNQVRNAVYALSNDSLEIKYNEWLAIRETLSSYYGMKKETIETLGVDITILESESNELEKELNRSVAGGLSGVNNEVIEYTKVRAALQSNQAAIEIIRIRNEYGESYTKDYYAAFIVQKNTPIQLAIIGEATELESKMSAYYKNAIAGKLKESLSYSKFWAPIQSSINGPDHLFVSSDGVYNLININSLMNEEGQYLIDLQLIEIIPNTKQLAIHQDNKPSNDEFVLIGNPTFGNSNISPLPGTSLEITSIQKLLGEAKIKSLSEGQATEEALKEILKPKVLHIATHGFFLGEEKDSNTSNITRSFIFSNPLLRSGLLLSGAGKTPTEALKENTSDGIFTAFDAMNLNLQNTDLVVLSACETGSGEIVNGEGVYGLSRAFTIAGAKNLIMSLWRVDDLATMELMKLFYQEWLANGDIKSSFSNAQKILKDKYQYPYYWGAFVLINN